MFIGDSAILDMALGAVLSFQNAQPLNLEDSGAEIGLAPLCRQSKEPILFTK